MALEATGIPGLPSIMNVVILISILSVGNSAIYASSRTLMSLDGLGHVKRYKWFNLGYIDRKGRPLVAVGFTLVFGLMAYGTLISKTGATTMFNWLMALSGLSSLFTWASICLAHIRFRSGLKAQGRATTELAYISPVGVAGSYYGLILNLTVIVAQIWIAVSPVMGKPTASQVLKTILGLPVVSIFYGAHKVYKLTTVNDIKLYVNASEMDLDSGRREPDIEAAGLIYEKERVELRAGPWWNRLYNFWC